MFGKGVGQGVRAVYGVMFRPRFWTKKNIHLGRGKVIKLLPQLQPCILQGGSVVSPVGPAGGDRRKDGVQKGALP